MGSSFFLPKFLLCFCIIDACYGAILFSSLPQTLIVSASPKPRQVLRSRDDTITVTWSLNSSESIDHVKAFLCYAPISQLDRPWRKTVDNLSKDKTCQFTIFNQKYESSMTNESVNWLIAEDVPSADYFIRVYGYDSSGRQVTYGQTSDSKKTENVFEIESITGITWHLEVASICACVFPLVSLVGFSLRERRKRKGVSMS